MKYYSEVEVVILVGFVLAVAGVLGYIALTKSRAEIQREMEATCAWRLACAKRGKEARYVNGVWWCKTATEWNQ